MSADRSERESGVSVAGSRVTGAAAAFLLVIGGYKLVAMGLAHPLAWLTGFAIDIAIVGVLWAAAIGAQRVGGRVARVVGAVCFWPLLALWFVASFAYTYFYPTGAERHYSLLAVGWSEVRFFVTQLLPAAGWLQLAALAVAWMMLARWIGRWGAPRWRLASMRWAAFTVMGSTLTAGTLASRVPDAPNPAVDIARDVEERLTEEIIPVGDDIAPAGPITLFDRSASAPLTVRAPFTRIVVVVMETMPQDTYRAELAALPADDMLRRLASHAHAYTRYYTVNQDSRTAMLDMLSSRLIPYEAYDDEDIYEPVTRLSNLPALLHAQGYATSYMLAQQVEERTVADLPWQRIDTLPQARIDSLKAEHWLCFWPYEFENSCEDKVMIGDVVQFLASHEKAFVYYEMMWGHNTQFNTASGKGNVQYTAEYVDSLWTAIEAAGLADQTLLVLTADHGDRAEDRLDTPANYQVPLFFYSPRLAPRVDDMMRSHLDFKELLLRELDPSRPLPRGMPFVHVVGPTETRRRVVIDSAGRMLGYKIRDGRAVVVSTTGPGAPDAASHLALFNRYQQWYVRLMNALRADSADVRRTGAPAPADTPVRPTTPR